jgi:hypothetical protein
MKEHNRLRLARLTARYAERRKQPSGTEPTAALTEFAELCRSVLQPVLEEVAAELRRAGHDPQIERGSDPSRPSLELALGLRGAAAKRNVVGFAVIAREGQPLEIQAYLEVNPPRFDLDRFSSAAALTSDVAERIVVEGVEHVLSCNAP